MDIPSSQTTIVCVKLKKKKNLANTLSNLQPKKFLMREGTQSLICTELHIEVLGKGVSTANL